MSDRDPSPPPAADGHLQEFRRIMLACVREQSTDIAALASVCLEYARRIEELERRVSELEAKQK